LGYDISLDQEIILVKELYSRLRQPQRAERIVKLYSVLAVINRSVKIPVNDYEELNEEDFVFYEHLVKNFPWTADLHPTLAKTGVRMAILRSLHGVLEQSDEEMVNFHNEITDRALKCNDPLRILSSLPMVKVYHQYSHQRDKLTETLSDYGTGEINLDIHLPYKESLNFLKS